MFVAHGVVTSALAMLSQQHIRTANIRAETFTELQVMHGEDFRALAEVFPEFQVPARFRATPSGDFHSRACNVCPIRAVMIVDPKTSSLPPLGSASS